MGKSFEVTFDKEFEVVRPKYTFEFILRREEDIDEVMMKRFSTDIHIQIATVGCVVLFTNLPRVERYSIIPYNSNAPLIDEVYRMIEEGKCKPLSDAYELCPLGALMGMMYTMECDFDKKIELPFL